MLGSARAGSAMPRAEIRRRLQERRCPSGSPPISSASMAASSNKYDKVSQPSVRARRASSLVSSPIYWADGRGLSSTLIGLIRCADMSDQQAAGGEGIRICKTFRHIAGAAAYLHEAANIFFLDTLSISL